MSGETPTTGAAVPRNASRTPGTPRMMPIETTGLLGGSSTTSARRMASSTPGAAGGAVEAGDDEAARRQGRLVPNPPLLEVDRPLAALAVVDDDVGLDRHVGHRHQLDAALRQPPARREPGGHLAERVALPEPLRAHDVGADVEVAEGEPLGHCAVGGELALHAVALVGATPALALVHAVAQRVEQGVEVGADPQPEQGDVVAGVRDDGDRRVGEAGRGVEVVAEAADEAGAADPAGEGRDVHVRESVSRVRGAASPPRNAGGTGKSTPITPTGLTWSA